MGTHRPNPHRSLARDSDVERLRAQEPAFSSASIRHSRAVLTARYVPLSRTMALGRYRSYLVIPCTGHSQDARSASDAGLLRQPCSTTVVGDSLDRFGRSKSQTTITFSGVASRPEIIKSADTVLQRCFRQDKESVTDAGLLIQDRRCCGAESHRDLIGREVPKDRSF